jgi:hypothetical protein
MRGLVVLVLLLGGCTTARDAAAPMVLVRAQKDLACPQDRIEVDGSAGGIWQATGCGHTVRYQSTCEGLQCAVSLDGEEPPAWRDRPEPFDVQGRGP